jgi:hypothetical protein
MMLTTLMLSAAALGRLDGLVPAIRRLPGQMAQVVNQAVLRADEMLAYFKDIRPIYLIYRGLLKGSAFNGRLVLEEIARTPGIAMEAGDFRQGPNEVIDERFGALLFVSEGHQGKLNLSLGRDILASGGKVMMVGRTNGWQETGGLSFDIADVPEELLPVLAVVPAQVPVAYGITPGTVTLLPNGPLDFGALDVAGKTVEMKLDLDLSSADMAAQLRVALISVIPDAQSKVVVTTGPVEPVSGTHYRLPLFITLRDASLPTVHYEGKIQISARPGDILTPPDGLVTVLFNRPAPVIQAVRLLPNGPVDFGLVETVGQTVIRPLNVELSDPKTPLTVTLMSEIGRASCRERVLAMV